MSTATFRGVPFVVESGDQSGGRRGVTHEYPFRDEPFREDLGRAARAFAVDGYVAGPGYAARRDALREALEAHGPEELVHPYFGTRRVAVTSFRIRESTGEGGMARFSIEFEETPSAPAQPTATVDTPAQMRVSAEAVRAAAQVELTARYKPGPPAFMLSVDEALRSATVAIDAALDSSRADVQLAAQHRRRVDRFKASLGALVRDPVALLAGLVGLVAGTNSFRKLLRLYRFNPGVRPPDTTPQRRQERANFDALQRVVQRLTLARAVELVSTETFETYDDALSVRAELLALIDDQTEVASDDTYPALVQLRADVVRGLPPPDVALPQLLQYTPAETVPSLVLAYQLYGDVSREAKIITRNRIRHPGFIVGGRSLEVLSDE